MVNVFMLSKLEAFSRAPDEVHCPRSTLQGDSTQLGRACPWARLGLPGERLLLTCTALLPHCVVSLERPSSWMEGPFVTVSAPSPPPSTEGSHLAD